MSGGRAGERAFILGLLGMLVSAGLWRNLGPPTRADALATVRALRRAGDAERAAAWLMPLVEGGEPGMEVERERDGILSELLERPSPRRRAQAWNLAQAGGDRSRGLGPLESLVASPSPAAVMVAAPSLPVVTPAPSVATPTPPPMAVAATATPPNRPPKARLKAEEEVVVPPEALHALDGARAFERACDFSAARGAARRAWELGAVAEVGGMAERIDGAASELERLRARFESAILVRNEGLATAAISEIETLCPDSRLGDDIRARWQEAVATARVGELTPPSSSPISELAPICGALDRGEWARAAELLESLSLTSESLESLAGAVYYNASLAAVRAGRCAEGRRFATQAARFDDPWRVPSNVSWWKTLVRMSDCRDFNLSSSLRFLVEKTPPRDLCPASRQPE